MTEQGAVPPADPACGVPGDQPAAEIPGQWTPLARGTSFESAIHQKVDRWAAVWGDDYTDTAKSNGLISRCRKGDGVLTILCAPGTGRPARVVLEMTLELGNRRDWHAYLEEAERNRDAQASIGIVRSVAQVPGGERTRYFGPSRMIVAFDPERDESDLLRVAIFSLRLQAISAVSSSGAGRAQLAAEKLLAAIELLENELAWLYQTTTLVGSHADKIATRLSTLRSRTYRMLTEASQDLKESSALLEES